MSGWKLASLPGVEQSDEMRINRPATGRKFEASRG